MARLEKWSLGYSSQRSRVHTCFTMPTLGVAVTACGIAHGCVAHWTGNKHDGKVPTKNSPQTASDLQKVDRIVHKDPLYKLTEEDVALLRKYRYYVKDEPCALSKVRNTACALKSLCGLLGRLNVSLDAVCS